MNINHLMMMKKQAASGNSPRIVAVGQGTNTIAYSDDNGANWTGLGTTYFPGQYGTCVATNGTRWLAGGSGLYKSDNNGVTWSAVSHPLTSVSGIACHGNTWIIVGEGSTNIARSTNNGDTWTATATSPLNSNGAAVAYNGSGFWVVVGYGVAWSDDDGVTWSAGTGYGCSQYEGLAYNGSVWVMGGNSGSGMCLAYSTDGKAWTDTGFDYDNYIGILGNQVRGVCWNGTKFIAVGQGYDSGYMGVTIASSTNGIDWINVADPFGSLGLGVCWNGSVFVAVGGTGGDTIATSTGGTTWTPINGSIFTSYGRGVASIPAPNLYPAIT